MLYTLIEHALSTNDSARYIRTLFMEYPTGLTHLTKHGKVLELEALGDCFVIINFFEKSWLLEQKSPKDFDILDHKVLGHSKNKSYAKKNKQKTL